MILVRSWPKFDDVTGEAFRGFDVTAGPFPLRVGDRWRWEILNGQDEALGAWGMFSSGPSYQAVGTWDLAIDQRKRNGQYQAIWTGRPNEGETSSRNLVLWTDGSGNLWMEGVRGPIRALELQLPPDPVSGEQVPCSGPLLGGESLSCSAVPLGEPPGPVRGILSHEIASSLFTAIATLGLYIPGTRMTRLELIEWDPAVAVSPSPLVEGWRLDPKLERLPTLLAQGPSARSLRRSSCLLLQSRSRQC